MVETATTRFVDLANRTNLTIEDHTRIVEAAQQNVFRIIRHLNPKELLIEGADPSELDVLNALLQVGAIDSYTRERVRLVIELQEALARDQSPEAVDAARQMQELVREKSAGADDVPTLIANLRQLRDDDGIRHTEGLNIGLSMAVEMLEHGLNTIYSPANDYNRLFWIRDEKDATSGAIQPRKSDVKDVAVSDAAGATGGAITGGMAGSIVPGGGTLAGAGTGAVIGAAGASTFVVAKKIFDWLF